MALYWTSLIGHCLLCTWRFGPFGSSPLALGPSTPTRTAISRRIVCSGHSHPFRQLKPCNLRCPSSSGALSVSSNFRIFCFGNKILTRRVLFQTASFVSFLLISHGYCIMCERLSVNERRTTASLACVFYLTLVGYRASVPYFSVLLLFNYLITFYVIFHHTSQNLLVLREQLSVIADEDVHTMHDAVYTKYIMFKKFQGAMQIVALAEALLYINLDDSSENYWLRLFVREWAQLCIVTYIGWTFRSQDLAPRFSVMPTLKSKGEATIPPIYSIEMDAATFKDFSSHEWHIGVATSCDESSRDPVIVIIQQPHSYRPTTASPPSIQVQQV
ncbi:hypothetical protein TIFTF001_006597 [Ficus carica]|uniref:Uncharacterized protein n=1 Tax=Ficus carica TaxID=3494 RepID=A0AA87ZHS1_FICCA|nr:hypothetical protein TIFTF001_006597 [Ficus carica]